MGDDKSTAVISQLVDAIAKEEFNKLANQVDAYAINLRVKKPNKGDVLSKILRDGCKSFDIEGFFKK